ncbi:MAG TPA: HEAT repeat domain-containing protein [Thermoanaerobaculia bacterium]|jgi:HEAT repeat protein|nr:HEAT repeat domain-containing protein [Thermoanaerobaculia bacterium]
MVEAEPSWEECMELLDQLPALPTEARVAAIERLIRNSSPVIRERALRTGAAVVSDERLESYLREEADDVLRNAGLEMLKMRGPRALGLAVRLLRDGDPDVVLQSVLALGHVRDLRALEPLRAALNHEDQNVAGAAIEAVGKLGDARAIPDLLPFLDGDPWLQLATIQALGDLRSPAAVPPLAKLLTDLMVGPLAAESLARIGGGKAFQALCRHWLRFSAELDAETMVGLLAHVLEGLSTAPRNQEELRASLAAVLAGNEEATRIAAARGLLALGPGPEDVKALEVLCDGPADASVLPAALAKRKDLVPDLLAQPGKARSWGFLLASRFPRAAPLPALAAAVRDELPPAELIGSIGKAFRKIHDPRLAAALLDLYLEAPADYRGALAPLMATHRNELKALLAERRDVDDEARLILAAHLGLGAREVVAHIVAMEPAEARLRVLEQVAMQEELVRQLPWDEWLAARPDLYAGLAARVAAEFSLRELVPPLRAQLGQRPNPDLIRAVGELGDRDSVPVLLGLLEGGAAAPAGARNLVPLILESLGRVGGPEARQAIRRAILEGRCEPRIGYRALSLCAIEEDDALFRRAVGHADWYVRLACADVLGRFMRPENLAALSQLAADPVGIVSQRALSFLEA